MSIRKENLQCDVGNERVKELTKIMLGLVIAPLSNLIYGHRNGFKLLILRLLWDFNINLLAFYHQRRSLIGYATHYLFCDR